MLGTRYVASRPPTLDDCLLKKARLQQASGAAVSTILKIMMDKDAPVASRLRAAESVVDHAAKAIEIEEIESRVSRR
jgi:hypothetical protein